MAIARTILQVAAMLTLFHVAVAQTTEWTGTVKVIFEHPEGLAPRHTYWLQTAAGDIELALASGGAPKIRAGDVARVRGSVVERKLGATDIQVVASAGEDVCGTRGEQKVVALMLNFPGTPKPDIDADALRQMLFGTTGLSLDGYWRDVSHGKTWATGDVFGWIDLDRPYDCGNPNNTIRDIRAAAARNQIDLTKYHRRLIYFADSCPVAGLSSFYCGGPAEAMILVNGSLDPVYHLYVTAHELGHQLGLNEAMGRSYPNAPLGAPENRGTRTTYYDPFTVMGNYYPGRDGLPGGFGHYNARQQFQIGWLSTEDVTTVDKPGSFRIAPLGSPAGSPKALRIARAATGGEGWIWVEYLQPAGPYLSGLPPQVFTGALIHYEDSINGRDTSGVLHNFTDLLDFTPRTDPVPRNDFRDAALAVGQTWQDPWTPLSISVTGADAQGLSISVSQDSCVTLAAGSEQFDWMTHTGTVRVQAPAGCQWSAVSSQPWVTVVAGPAGTGSGTVNYTVATNGDRFIRKATLAIGRQPLTIVQDGAPQSLPQAVNVVPSSGAGFTQTFTFRYSDANGADDVSQTEAEFIDTARRHCTVEYTAASQTFRVWSDSDRNGQSAAVGSDKSIQTDTCSLDVAGSSFSKSGNEVTVKAAIGFRSTFSGSKKILGFAYARGGNLAGPVSELGSWMVGAPAPAISAGGVVNAASFAGGPIAPGEIVTIFGPGFGPAQLVSAAFDSAGFLPGTVGSTRVLFDGVPGPMVYAAGGQVSAIVPFSAGATGNTSVRVEYEGRLSDAVTAPVALAAPGIFAYPSRTQAVIVNQDGSFNADSQPAARGSVITLFATGAGRTIPAGIDGKLPVAPDFPAPEGAVEVTFGGAPGQVQFAGMIYPGVLQINVVVPSDADAGPRIPLVLSVGGAASAAGVTIALQ